MQVFLEAGPWDVVVALIGIVPTIIVIAAVLVACILFWPQIRQRISTGEIAFELPDGTKVRFAAITSNLVTSVADLQKQLGEVKARQDAESRIEPTDDTARSATFEEEDLGADGGGKGAGPEGPLPSDKLPGLLIWIDRHPEERTIERTQLATAGWVISVYRSMDEASRGLPGRGGAEPQAIVVVLPVETAPTQVVASLAQLLPPAATYIYHPSLAWAGSTVTFVGGVFITASAVELLSALTATRCGHCGRLLPEPGNLPAELRKPCPNCGSTSRAVSRSAVDRLTPLNS
jgi:hypothetical protein